MRRLLLIILCLTLAPLAAGAPRQVEDAGGSPAAWPQEQGKQKPRRRWVPGHYEVQRMRVPGAPTTRRVWVAPVYRTSRDSRGNTVQVLLKAGHWKLTRIPGADRWVLRRVWVKGRWVRS